MVNVIAKRRAYGVGNTNARGRFQAVTVSEVRIGTTDSRLYLKTPPILGTRPAVIATNPAQLPNARLKRPLSAVQHAVAKFSISSPKNDQQHMEKERFRCFFTK